MTVMRELVKNIEILLINMFCMIKKVEKNVSMMKWLTDDRKKTQV